MSEEIILEKFSQRLSGLIKEYETDIKTLQDLLGLKSISSVYRYINGNMSPKLTAIKYLAEYYNVNPTWLMGYDVSMRTEKEFNKVTSKHELVKDNIYYCPVYGNISAGIPLEAIEDILDYEEIPKSWTNGDKEYFGLRIKGNSMFPNYMNGDTVIFEKTNDCENGSHCAVMVNGNDATFKKVLKNEAGITLMPLNEEYEPQFYSNKQIKELPVTIIGVAKEIRRKLNF